MEDFLQQLQEHANNVCNILGNDAKSGAWNKI